MEQINKELLVQVIDVLNRFKKHNDVSEIETRKIDVILKTLVLMKNHEDCWQSLCPYCYKRYSQDLIERLNTIKTDDTLADINLGNKLLLILMYFLRELILYKKRKKFLSIDEIQIWREFLKIPEEELIYQGNKDNYQEISKKTRADYEPIYYLMSNELEIDILNDYYDSETFQAFLNFKQNIELAEQYSQELKEIAKQTEQEIDNKITEIQAFEDNLKNLKTGYNFVGLSKGFSDLLEQKKKSEKWLFWGLISLGSLIAGTLGFILYREWAKEVSWQQMLTGLGLELALIYFFRVVLNRYHAVQTQIMQLQLRLSLCQFIQSYAEYAKEIKENSETSLAKFEEIIFSNIVAKDNQIPSTFDGLESLANLIKTVK